MIDMIHCSKYYTMGDEVIRAMDDVSLHVDDREYLAIVGPSGSGKSTLMHLLGCLDMADKGQYLLDGLDVTLCTDTELAVMRSRKL